MIDKQAIILDLQEKKLTQGQIAQKHNCSRVTVVRIVREYDLQYGQGLKFDRPSNGVKVIWKFEKMTPELAYLIGIYITDGNLRFDYYSGKVTTVSIASTTIEIIDQCAKCLQSLELPCKISKIKKNQFHLGNKQMYTANCYSTLFSQWVFDVCGKKSKIPQEIMQGDIECKIAFICGAIDGDGSVSKQGAITLRGIDNWLFMLPDLLESLGIPCTGCSLVSMLKSGKEFRGVYINRKHFIEFNPHCYHPVRQDRMYNAKEDRGRRPKRYKYPCPVCGELKMTNKGALSCRDCYLKSDRFHDHLVKIAPAGNKKANQVRWHKD